MSTLDLKLPASTASSCLAVPLAAPLIKRQFHPAADGAAVAEPVMALCSLVNSNHPSSTST